MQIIAQKLKSKELRKCLGKAKAKGQGKGPEKSSQKSMLMKTNQIKPKLAAYANKNLPLFKAIRTELYWGAIDQ